MDVLTIVLAVVSIIAGAWLQAYFGIFQDRKSRIEEKNELRKDMIKSLLIEIEYNNDLLEKGLESRTKYQHRAFWHLLRINRITSAVSSEQYSLLSPETQDKLSEYYEKAQHMNELVRKLDGEERALIIQKIRSEQNELLNTLKSIAPDLRSLLESE